MNVTTQTKVRALREAGRLLRCSAEVCAEEVAVSPREGRVWALRARAARRYVAVLKEMRRELMS